MALAVVRFDVRDTAASRAYVDRPAYGVWGGLVLLQVTTWAVLGVVSARWAYEVRCEPPHDDRSRWQVALAWLGAAVAGAALLLAQALAMPLTYDRSYPDHLQVRVTVMVAVVALVAAVPAVALWGVRKAAAEIHPRKAEDVEDAVDRFAALWARQRGFLYVLSAILVLVILATAAKYDANNDFTPPSGEPLPDVPTTFVLVVGVIYGAILLAVYLPPYFATRRVGEDLAHTLAALPRAESAPIQSWETDKLGHYRDTLGLSEGTKEHIERSTVLLAPLLTALVTTLLPGVEP
jgi:hypothetical protein